MLRLLTLRLKAAGYRVSAADSAEAALTALQIGVSGEQDVAWALRHLYEATRKALLDNVLSFDAKTIETIRGDFTDILRAMTSSGAA